MLAIMDVVTESHLAALKAALKTLHHSGPTGFEMLWGTAARKLHLSSLM
jgi:hypothetical protein